MGTVKKLFGEYNVSWKFVIIFSVLIGIVVGVLNRIPALVDTSFQDIAISFEMWIVFALFIIMNSKKVFEAVAKCFVFFLISQPIIYAVELVVDVTMYDYDVVARAKEFFLVYYLNGWFIWTLLTIPGAFIAYQVKKKNLLGAVILAVVTGYWGFKGTFDAVYWVTEGGFPHHLLNTVLCFAFAVVFTLIFFDEKKLRAIPLAVMVAAMIFGGVMRMRDSAGPTNADQDIEIPCTGNIVEIQVDNDAVAQVLADENGKKEVTVYSGYENGVTEFVVKDSDGKEYRYSVELTKDSMTVTPVE